MKLGTRFILTGKTRHGKNRVREHGTVWEVTRHNEINYPHTAHKTEIRSVLTGARRWVRIGNDPDFSFEEEQNDHPSNDD